MAHPPYLPSSPSNNRTLINITTTIPASTHTHSLSLDRTPQDKSSRANFFIHNLKWPREPSKPGNPHRRTNETPELGKRKNNDANNFGEQEGRRCRQIRYPVRDLPTTAPRLIPRSLHSMFFLVHVPVDVPVDDLLDGHLMDVFSWEHTN